MPTITIMLWNTQHLNDQNQKLPMSEAYEEKLDALVTAACDFSPDIIALFEVGTTARPNNQLVKDLAGIYELKASLDQDGGKKKNTTLGAMVFVANDIAGKFHEPYKVPLGSKGNRSTLLLQAEGGQLFAFCHANAHGPTAFEQVTDDIRFVGGNADLVFFGGDLNHQPGDSLAEVKVTNGNTMLRCLPGTCGFTHVSIRSSLSLAKAMYQEVCRNTGGTPGMSESTFINNCMGTDVAWGDLAIPSLLDYAFIAEKCRWKSACEASVQVTTLKFENKQLDHVYYFQKDKVYSQVQRIYRGKKLRSDHFPVIYEIEYP